MKSRGGRALTNGCIANLHGYVLQLQACTHTHVGLLIIAIFANQHDYCALTC